MEKQEEGEGEGRLKMLNIEFFLPNDVLVAGILTKLPARKLLQLRCVCKNWYGLISDPSFVKMHYDNAISINHPLLVISHSYVRLHPYHRPRVDKNTKYELRSLGSCNGLLCFSIVAGIHMRIWNPCTREFKDITRPPVLSQPRLHWRCEFYGFGYDCISNDYKIVRNTCFFRHNDHSYPYYSLVDVYTLGTDSWKRINGNYPYKPLLYDKGVFVNGGLYWIVRKSGVSDMTLVIRFDVAKEEYREISIPQSVVNDENFYLVQLIELEGCLCMLTNENSMEKKAWRLKDYGVHKEDSWTNLFTVKQPIIDSHTQAMSFKVIRICKNGEVLVVQGSRYLVWYNPNTDKTRFISKTPDIDRPDSQALETCTCIESLVSLNSGTYMGRDLKEEDRLQFRTLALGFTSIVNGF